ncbi:FtsB family cell division protein [Clostridium isatidis]|uniref:FtsB family cell division protein n=1 Tax=Clostridium isatidis TaxID=182773 RepID=UPI00214FD4D1|nr:septum formation initiator family protein [Clostridium isatidis]
MFAIFIFNYIKQGITIKEIQKEITVSQQELEELRDKNAELQRDLESIGSDEYIEKSARERLGMVKEGEKVVNSQEQN